MHFGFAGLLILTVFANSIWSKDFIRGCYYTNWSQYHPGMWKFLPENIEAGLCTHIFYAFAAMDDNFNLTSVEPNDLDGNGTAGLYTRVNALKQNQSDLKTLLSFGGYLFSIENGPLMHKLLNSSDNRKIFIDSAIAFVRLHQFDGFDFNWFPQIDTKDNFVQLVKEFRHAIEIEAQNNTQNGTANIGTPNNGTANNGTANNGTANNGTQAKLLLTVGVPSHIDQIAAGYNGSALAESVDWLNVMAFDYHGPWENQTGFNRPLYDNGDGLSVNSTVSYLINTQQVPKDKLVIGSASYGHGWTLPSSSSPNMIPSPAVGPSPAQPFTLANGTAAYFEICTLIEKQNFIVRYDDVEKSPYIFKDGVWIGYSNQESYRDELAVLIQKDLAGAFVWSLDMDDFLGQCSSSNGTYPLVKTVQSMLVSK